MKKGIFIILLRFSFKKTLVELVSRRGPVELLIQADLIPY